MIRRVVSSVQEFDDLVAYMRGIFAAKGKAHVLQMKQVAKNRSTRQNSLYWMWLNAIAAECSGLVPGTQRPSKADVDDLHEYYANRFLPADQKVVFGDLMYKRRSTTELTTAEFTAYLEQIKADALNRGIYLPEPNDPGWDSFVATYGEQI